MVVHPGGGSALACSVTPGPARPGLRGGRDCPALTPVLPARGRCGSGSSSLRLRCCCPGKLVPGRRVWARVLMQHPCVSDPSSFSSFYNSFIEVQLYAIRFTCAKREVQWFSLDSRTRAAIAIVSFTTLSLTQKETPPPAVPRDPSPGQPPTCRLCVCPRHRTSVQPIRVRPFTPGFSGLAQCPRS